MTVVYVKRVKGEVKSLRLQRKRHSEEARELLAFAVASEYGLSLSDYAEKREEKGKPYLEGAPFHYNLSHSGDYVVCALSDSRVGVDVEKILPISVKVMRRFLGKAVFSPREQMRLWTRYESYGKMMGHGIPYPAGSEKECFYREYTVLDHYYITVCSEADAFADSLVLVDDIGRMLPSGS